MKMLNVIEEISLNAWPSLQTMMLDGWVLRFANGYTKRANSINPLYYSTLNTDEKIHYCEKIYKEKGLDVVFKMTPSVYPQDLDNLLESKGYIYDSPTGLQILELAGSDPAPDVKAVFSENLSREWLADFCRLIYTEERNRFTLKNILSNIVPVKCFASIREQGNPVASGLAVLQDKYLGLYNIVTAENSRNKGYGRQMVLNLLRWGKEKGAETAYLQVELSNKPALKIYSRLNFKEAYRYWYRIKTRIYII